MALEIERKYLGVDFASLITKLEELGAAGGAPHFETNIILDRANEELHGQGRLLRLRLQEWPGKTRCKITFKKPVAPLDKNGMDGKDALPLNDPSSVSPLFKKMEELEVTVSDFDEALSLLGELGFVPWARYEKIRRGYELALPESGEKVKIELDYLYFAQVVEIEGKEELINQAEILLGLDKTEKSLTNYHKLHQDWLRSAGLPPQLDFVFDDDQKKRLRAEIGLEESI